MTENQVRTPLSPLWRVWMVVEAFFGLAAIATLFLRPQETATSFAWDIQPHVMAAVLGGFYVATASLFLYALFASNWQQVRAVALPGAIFSTAMLVATFLHWDKFSVGTFPFLLWLISYVLPPPMYVGLHLWHQRRAAPIGSGISSPLPQAARTLLRVNGFLLTGVAVLGYAVPAALMAVAPWALTPLTTRTLCGWLLVVGLLQVAMAWEGDWDRVRVVTPMMIILPIALIGQLVRFADQVEWRNVALWALLVDFGVVAAVCLSLWFAARRAPESTAQRGPAGPEVVVPD